MQVRARPWLRFLPLLLVGAFVLLASGSREIVTFTTDLLWYRELGQEGVFWTLVTSRLGTGAASGLAFFAILYGNIFVARRMAPRSRYRPGGLHPVDLEQALLRLRERLDPHIDRLLLVASILLAVLFGSAVASRWSVFQLFLHQVPFGEADPQFGRDLGFFVFSLPALRLFSDWLTGALLFTFVATMVVHVFDGAIRPWDPIRGFEAHVKGHLSVILGFVALSKAFDYYLQTFELNFSPRGQVLGASYTDVYAQLPALWILLVISVLSALALLLNIRYRGWKVPAVALGSWGVAWLLVGQLYPAIVQQFRVTPNEVAAEAPFIARNIEATTRAFDLQGIEVLPFAADDRLDATELAEEAPTIENVRLWDPNIITKTYKQLQEIRFYYDFNDVDIDRYTIDGKFRQVLISVREMNVGQLSREAKTWVNEHLVYTHGYGAVVSPVNEATPNGLPNFLVRDIPPVTATDLVIGQPAIYFGEETTTYAIVNTRLPEFDYPVGDKNAVTTYAGRAGVPVGGFFRRVLFAVRFGSAKILLSDYIRPESRVLFHRPIRERVERLAPWLAIDRDPYPAVVNGRIYWFLDGYTQSSHYPYSQRLATGTNYLRNSVKVIVDAYHGSVWFYGIDSQDPVLAAWRKIFPGLILEGSEVPEAVRAHFRYPEDLFRVQAEVYKTYHMQDPQVFYNKEDQWAIPGEAAGRAMRPFYALMRLPQAERAEFLLLLPFTPRTKDNMIGWMAAKSDPPGYGERLVYTLPKQKLVLGPEQVMARINQDPVISQQLSLWNQRGGSVIFGNMLVLPIKESILYVLPLYLQAEQTAMPALTRVIVLFGERLAMEPDLDTALERVFSGRPSTADRRGGVSLAAGPTTAPPPPTGTGWGLARELYQRALAAQRAGDWAGYGRQIEELGKLIERLAAEGSPAPGR
jgi:uncharacterized protein